MSKNFIKNNNLYIITKKKLIFSILFFVFIVLLLSVFFVIKGNNYVISNSKSVHKRNIVLNEKIQELKNVLIEKNLLIDKLSDKNNQLSGIFNKYTDAVKFKVATADEVKKNIFAKDEEILELNRKINYYKFLLNSKNKNDSLIVIEEFSILDQSDNILTYSFLLLSNKNEKKIKGTFQLFYDGINNDSGKKILNKQLKVSNDKISFKNFLKISGELKFPKNMTYNTIYLKVICNKKIYNYKKKIN